MSHAAVPASGMVIKDMTETNITQLRHTIYLTIMSSITFDECAHKLLKMTIKPGQEVCGTQLLHDANRP